MALVYHSHFHPHRQQVESRKRSFIMSALHTAHDRIHMASSS
jgi:hypothetical protein